MEIFEKKDTKVSDAVFYSKSNETIKRHRSDSLFHPMPIDKMSIDIWFVCTVQVAQLVPTIVLAWSKN